MTDACRPAVAAASRRPGTPGRALAILLAAALLSACGGGPSDYVRTSDPVADPGASTVPLRTETQQQALERDLQSAGNAQIGAGRRADDSLPSAMALAILRQQQAEEARRLIDEAGPVPPAAPCPAGQAVCPAAPATATK